MAATVSVGGRRCAVASATPLAALALSRVGPLRLRDFGSCSRRPADGGGLFVAGIGGDRNRGQDGWVYKVGNRLGTAGAADPSGPFGRGGLRSGQRVTWFYCRFRGRRGCQRTLALRIRTEGRTLEVRALAFDSAGRGAAAGGATVRAGSLSATADRRGFARFTLPPGGYRVEAERRDLIRSFPETVTIR